MKRSCRGSQYPGITFILSIFSVKFLTLPGWSGGRRAISQERVVEGDVPKIELRRRCRLSLIRHQIADVFCRNLFSICVFRVPFCQLQRLFVSVHAGLRRGVCAEIGLPSLR